MAPDPRDHPDASPPSGAGRVLVAAAAAVALTVGGSLAVLAGGGGDTARIPDGTRTTATPTTSTTPTATEASPSGGPSPRAPAATAVPPGQPRAGSQGSVVVPPGQRDLLLNVSFKGVTLGRVGDRFEVVYPQVYATRGRDGSQAVHVKLPLWSCSRRVSQRSQDFSGCRDRRVSYVDVVGGRDVVVVRPDGSVALSVEGYAYSYQGGGDRGPGLSAAYTGRVFTVTAQVRPGARQGEVEGLVEHRATGVVQVDGVRALQDDRYANLIRSPH